MLSLTPAAISFLTQLILSLAFTVFLFNRMRNQREPSLQLLTTFFALITLFIGLLFLDVALTPYARLFIVYAENTLLALALVFLLQFAYRFPQTYPQFRVEARTALFFSFAYFLWEGQFMIIRYVALLRDGIVEYRPAYASYLTTLVLFWIPFAFLHQCIAADTRSVSWHQKLWQPNGNAAQRARTFALIFGILLVLGIIDLLRIFSLPHTFYNAAMSVGILIAIWLFASNYINFIPGGAKVHTKLSVLALTLFLSILGLAGWLIAPPYIATFQPNLYDHQTIRFTPNASGKYDVKEVDFNFETTFGEKINLGISEEARYQKVEFQFPFYDQLFTDIYVVNAGAITLGEPYWHPNMQLKTARTPAIFPLLIDLNPSPSDGIGGVYFRKDADRLVLT